jgi:hypothetical protein
VSTYAPEYRPFRVATYIVYFAFTLTFIGLVIRSVWKDLYGRPPGAAVQSSQPAVLACADDLESLDRELESRLAQPLAPHAARNWERYESEWNGFTRKFEDRLRTVQNRCIDRPPIGAAVRDAMESSVDRLDNLRQHLARCGLEGERERQSVQEALTELRETISAAPAARP